MTRNTGITLNILRALLFTLILSLVASHAVAQTFEDYVKLRKKYGISQATGVEALETLLGKRILEVKGVVKGTIGGPGGYLLLLETASGDPIHVDASEVPEWLQGNEVPARLLVRASRDNEDSRATYDLIGAASEQRIGQIEEAAEAKRRAAAKPLNSRSFVPPKKIANWQLPASDAVPYYASFIKGRNSRLSERESIRIAQGIIGFSIKYGVDARLIMAMVMIESGFDPSATSRTGAMGLGQLMPGTARGMGVGDAYDSIQNLYGTVRLVRGHLEKYNAQTGDGFQSLVLALAAYNAGSGAVRRHGGVPPFRETQNYVRKVIAAYQRLAGQS